MYHYLIANAPSDSWIVVSSPEPGGFQPDVAHALSTTLGGVCLAFEGIFGKNVLFRYPRLTVRNSLDTPQCFSEVETINLSTEGNFPQQHIYQFAHELCHFVIHQPVCAHYRWLEETLCELMSWCVLSWIYANRVSAPLSTMNGIYDSIPRYISNSRQDRLDLGGFPLHLFVAKNLTHLRSDCYDRRLNRSIANELFPLFLTHPELWQIVFRLPYLSNTVSLYTALHFICDMSGTSKDLRNDLVRLLVGQA